VIRNIRHKGLRLLFETDNARGVPAEFAYKLRRILLALDSGPLPAVLDVPGYRLHALTANRRGTWSTTVSRNWRVTFEIDGEDAVNVDFEDYH
jgi:proteic killer suppression protein